MPGASPATGCPPAGGPPEPEAGNGPARFAADPGRGGLIGQAGGGTPGRSRRTLRGARGGRWDASVCFADETEPGPAGTDGSDAGSGVLLGSRAANLPADDPNPVKSVPDGSLSLSELDRDVNSVSSCATALSSACASRSIASSGTGGSRLRN